MKRSVVPIMVLMLVLVASYLWTAPVTLPYPPVPNTLIRATEQLANYNAIVVGVNSINNAQIAADAAIDGFKIKAYSIGADRLASSVTNLIASAVADIGSYSRVINVAGSSTITFPTTWQKGMIYLDGCFQEEGISYTHASGSANAVFSSPIPYGVDSCSLVKP